MTANAARVLPVGQWSHLAATYDGSVSRLYVNGVLVATGATDTRALINQTAALTIGALPSGTNRFKGTIDEAALYSGELSRTRINADYITGLGQ